MTKAISEDFFLSTRSKRATKPALPYFDAFISAKKRPWSKQDQEGNIIASVAENKLCSDMVQERMSAVGTSFSKELLGYDNMKGLQPLREAFCNVLMSTFMKGVELRPEHLCVSSGCGAVIDNLFFCIGAAGSSVLIPAPYYPAFDNDLAVKADIKSVPVHLDLESPLGPQLDAATAAAAASGHPVTAILITCPNNPTGTVYSDDALQQMMEWGLLRKIHVVSDEVYGNSVFADDARFSSMEILARRLESKARESITNASGSLDNTAQGGLIDGMTNQSILDLVPKLVHIIFGLSKDFCGSGLRVGVLHTRNAKLLQALDNLSYFCAVSNVSQHTITQMLNDKEWLDLFFNENRRRLKHAYTVLEESLTSYDIPFTPSVAAMFTWLDLSEALVDPESWEAESDLWRELTETRGILLTPGSTCHSKKPGCFRFCWASVDPECIPEAARRIHEVYSSRVLSKKNA
mmetsp:Transcript_10576/g.19351  ORF Transcript_10576/g.19351 Transcript_10576/m.19351 type:complete len:463 (-) Transcript_10576:418-1806(-)